MHQNFVGIDGNKSPFVLSVCLTDADNYGVPQYRAILWRKTVRFFGLLPCAVSVNFGTEIKKKWETSFTILNQSLFQGGQKLCIPYQPNKPITPKAVLQ